MARDVRRVREVVLIGAAAAVVTAAIRPAMAAEISVSDAVLDFLPGQARFKDVTVKNRSNETAYVEITLTEIQSPGLDDEKVVEIGKQDTDKIVIAPRKLVLPPGGDKRVRVISRLDAVRSDRIFRAQVKPVEPPDAQAKDSRLGVNVVIAYGLLIMVRPDTLRPALEGKRVGKVVTFRNSGNTNVLLRSGEQCPPAASAPAPGAGTDGGAPHREPCVTIKGRRVYPGAVWSQELQWDAPVKFSLRIGDEHLARVYE